MPPEFRFGGPELYDRGYEQFQQDRALQAQRANEGMQRSLYDHLMQGQIQDHLLREREGYRQQFLDQGEGFRAGMADQSQGAAMDRVQVQQQGASDRIQQKFDQASQQKKNQIASARQEASIEQAKIMASDPHLQNPANQQRMQHWKAFNDRLDASEAGIKPLPPDPPPLPEDIEGEVNQNIGHYAIDPQSGQRQFVMGGLPPGISGTIFQRSVRNGSASWVPHEVKADQNTDMIHAQMEQDKMDREQARLQAQHDMQLEHDRRQGEQKIYLDRVKSADQTRQMLSNMTKPGPAGPDGKSSQSPMYSPEELDAEVTRRYGDLDSQKPSWWGNSQGNREPPEVANMPHPTSRAERDQLPKGSQYVAPDGTVKVRVMADNWWQEDHPAQRDSWWNDDAPAVHEPPAGSHFDSQSNAIVTPAPNAHIGQIGMPQLASIPFPHEGDPGTFDPRPQASGIGIPSDKPSPAPYVPKNQIFGGAYPNPDVVISSHTGQPVAKNWQPLPTSKSDLKDGNWYRLRRSDGTEYSAMYHEPSNGFYPLDYAQQNKEPLPSTAISWNQAVTNAWAGGWDTPGSKDVESANAAITYYGKYNKPHPDAGVLNSARNLNLQDPAVQQRVAQSGSTGEAVQKELAGSMYPIEHLMATGPAPVRSVLSGLAQGAGGAVGGIEGLVSGKAAANQFTGVQGLNAQEHYAAANIPSNMPEWMQHQVAGLSAFGFNLAAVGGNFPAFMAMSANRSYQEAKYNADKAGFTGAGKQAYALAHGAIDLATNALLAKFGAPAKELADTIGGAAQKGVTEALKSLPKAVLGGTTAQSMGAMAGQIVDKVSGMDPDALTPGRIADTVKEAALTQTVFAGVSHALLPALASAPDAVRAMIDNPSRVNVKKVLGSFIPNPELRQRIADVANEAATKIEFKPDTDGTRGYTLEASSGDNKDLGTIYGTQNEDSIRISASSVASDYRGQGIGTKMYQRLVDEADSTGRSVTSDNRVSESAVNVYKKLQSKGYIVEQNPDAQWETNSQGERTLALPKNSYGSVFTVRKGPSPDAGPDAGTLEGSAGVTVDHIQTPQGLISTGEENAAPQGQQQGDDLAKPQAATQGQLRSEAITGDRAQRGAGGRVQEAQEGPEPNVVQRDVDQFFKNKDENETHAAMVDDVHKEAVDQWERRTKAVEAARKSLGSPKQIADIENRGGDITSVSGYDEKIGQLAQEYPDFVHDENSAWDLAKGEKPNKPRRDDPEIVREASARAGVGNFKPSDSSFDFGANIPEHEEPAAAFSAIPNPLMAFLPTERITKVVTRLLETRGTKEAVAYLKDAGENAAAIHANRESNDVRGTLRRAVGKSELPLAEQALTFYHEAAGDPGTLNDMARKISDSEAGNAVKRQALLSIKYALDNGDKLADASKLYADKTNAQVESEWGGGFDTLQYPNYVPHAQDVDNFASGGGGAGDARSFLKNREHPTYADSIAAGVKPKSLNAVDLLKQRLDRGQRLIAGKAWIASMAELKDGATGKPLTAEPETMQRANGTSYQQAPDGYKMQYLGSQPVAVQNGYEGIFDALTSPSMWDRSMASRGFVQANATGKSITLLVDTFHLGRMAMKIALNKMMNFSLPGYRKGLSMLDFTPAELTKMADAGELPQQWLPELLQKKANVDLMISQGLNVGRINDAMYHDVLHSMPLIGAINNFTFDKFQRGGMTEVALLEHDRLRKADPNMSDEEVARSVAKQVNTFYGSLGKQGLFKSKGAQDTMKLLFLAPQWNEGLIRTELGAIAQTGQFAVDAIRGRRFYAGMLMRSVGGMAIAQFVMNQAINMYTRGKPTWENPEEGMGAKLSAWVPDVVGNGPGFFLHPLGLAAETTHLFMNAYDKTGDFQQGLRNMVKWRASTLMRPMLTFMTREDFLGRKIRPDNLWGELVKSAIPAPIAAATAGSAVKQLVTGENQEQFPGQYQKQLMQSAGVRVDSAPSAETRMHHLAGQFNREKGIEPSAEYYAGDFEPLVTASKTGNKTAFKDALSQLREKKTDEQIAKHFTQWVNAPYTGQKEREGEFMDTLSPEQQQAYERSRQDRRKIASDVLDKLDPDALSKIQQANLKVLMSKLRSQKGIERQQKAAKALQGI